MHVSKWSASTSSDVAASDQAGSSQQRGRGSSRLQTSQSERPAPMKVPQGTLLPSGLPLCPLYAILRLGTKFRDAEWGRGLGQPFFGRDFFFRHGWNIYYAWPPYGMSANPTLWLLKHEVEGYLEKVNQALRAQYELLPEEQEKGLVVEQFPDHVALRPRFLAYCNDEKSFTKHEAKCPTKDQTFEDDPFSPALSSPEERAAYQDIMTAHLKLIKNYGVSKAFKKKQRNVARLQWRQAFKMGERFLGMRPDEFVPRVVAEDAPWSEHLAAEDERMAAARPLRPVKVDELAPFPFLGDVVFFSIDVEVYELNKDQLTEVGICTLDTREIKGLAPGKDGANWFDKVQAKHFIVKEYAHLKNQKFVDGCPDKFSYGSSEVVRLKNISNSILSCMRPPFCADISSEDHRRFTRSGPYDDSRTLVLVGHSIESDLKFLAKAVKFDLLKGRNVGEFIMDTSHMWQSLMHETQPRSLLALLKEFGVEARFLHNAGNDAVYTLRVMLAIFLRSCTMGRTDELQDLLAKRHEARVQEAIDAAVAKAEEDALGWGSDGDVSSPHEAYSP